MKPFLIPCLLSLCFASALSAQDEKPFTYLTNDFELPTNAVFSGPPAALPFPGDPVAVDSPAAAVNFLALGDNNTVTPPDTQGAVGISNLVTMLNSQVRIQNRQGTNVATTNLSSFWNAVGSFNNITDPRIVYDPFSNRWIASAMVNYSTSSPSNALVIGVSRSENPAFTNWNQYRIRVDTSGTVWADQPVIGFNKDWIVLQGNLIRTSAGTGYGTLILIFTKTNLYSGLTDSFRTMASTTIGYSQTPAVTLDAGATNIFLAQNILGRYPLVSGGQTNYSGVMRLYEIYGPVGTEAIRTFDHVATNTPWADFSPVDNFAPQLGLNVNIMNNDSRVRSVVTRGKTIWCAHNVFLPSTNPTRSSVQWWQFRADGVVAQTGLVDDPAGIRFFAFPSVAVNRFGDALVGFSSFATNQYASASYSYRNYSDNNGDLEIERIYRAGDGIYYRSATRNRWGDYSATVVDPVNDADFWTIQEYAATPVNPGTSQGNGRWGTWWARLDVTKPGNDFFTDSYQITGASGSTNGTTVRATRETSEPNHAGNTNGASIWYHWTSPASGNVVIDTTGSGGSMAVAVYTGSSVASLTLVTNDVTSPGRVIFNATASTTYRIAVDGRSGSMSATGLNWQQSTTPVFVTQPQGQMLYAGSTASFTSLAIGNPAATYQWRFAGTVISGATNASYTKTNVQTNDSGGYIVVASNTSGSVTSAVAQLTVLTTAATLAGPTWAANNAFQLTVVRETNLNYIIQVNTNLNYSNWVSVVTNTAPFTYTDNGATNSAHRFYRAIYRP